MEVVVVNSRAIDGTWRHFPTQVGHLEVFFSKGHEIGKVFREHPSAPVIVIKFDENLPLCNTIEQAKAVVMACYVSLHN